MKYGKVDGRELSRLVRSLSWMYKFSEIDIMKSESCAAFKVSKRRRQ